MALINNLPLLPAERVMYRHGTALRAAPSNNNKATRIVNKNSTFDTVFLMTNIFEDNLVYISAKYTQKSRESRDLSVYLLSLWPF
mgnify:CR=1 FL=1